MIEPPPTAVKIFNQTWFNWLNNLYNYVQGIDSETISVTDYGALGDAGVTDSTSAIQAALDTGKTVYVPAVDDPTTEYYKLTSTLTLTADGQKIYGDGWGSILRQTTSDLNVIEASLKSNVETSGLHLYCVGTISSINGSGILLDGCSESLVQNCYIENNRAHGVVLKDTNDTKILNNTILNSPVLDTDVHTNAGSDIYLAYSSSRNTVTGNHCKSTNQNGIALQTILNGDACDDNVIMSNIIENARGYGILVYRLLTSTLYRNKVIGNTIKGVTGNLEDATFGAVYGSGVYIQGAEYTVVSVNTIEDTNSGTTSEQLAPGAIGATNVTNVTVSDNVITNPSWYGITVRDPANLGLTTGFAVVQGNSIFNAGKDGIQVDDRGEVIIKGNTVDTTTLDGIAIDNTTATDPFIAIEGNSVKNTTQSGINVAFAAQCSISDNLVDTCTISGIVAADSDDVTINSNIVSNCTVRGIQNQSTNTSVSINDNIVRNNGVGMLIQAAARLSNNIVDTNTTDWQGTYQLVRTLDDTGTPSIAGGRLFKTGGTTAITDFDNGVVGDIIEILAAHSVTITDGTPIILAGGANFAMVATDTLTLRMFNDQVWQEISRSVN